MKKKEMLFIKIGAWLVTAALSVAVFSLFRQEVLLLATDIAVFAVKSYLPVKDLSDDEKEITVNVTAEVTSETRKETTTHAETTKPKEEKSSLTDIDSDIKKLISEREKTADKDKKDSDIKEYQYINDGVTDKYGRVRVKNVNKTQIDIEKKLEEKIDLSVTKDKPAVLIFHTHTTETYQILDRGFYEEGFMTRSNDKGRNMVRVGDAICEQIEKAGYKVIHDTAIYDAKYSGAYDRSRKGVEQYLKKYPSIQIVLDIHRDAIQQNNGTKIKPVAEIDGKKAAQLMIISGCQEEGNSVTNLPDWQYNLTFAVHLQNKLEEMYEGITRPLYFCPRSYNMNLTHCSLLVEVGSDSNTLDEAVYAGKCLGTAVAEILKEYEEQK